MTLTALITPVTKTLEKTVSYHFPTIIIMEGLCGIFVVCRTLKFVG